MTDHWAKAVEALREAFKGEGYAASQSVANLALRAALPHLVEYVCSYEQTRCSCAECPEIRATARRLASE